MDQVALDQLAARASAAGFSSIAEYAENLEKTLQRILDHGKTHEEPCWALHNGDCADVFQEFARVALGRPV